MSHTSYREYIANYLITPSVQTAELLRKNTPQIVDNSQLGLIGRHFICKIKWLNGAKRKTPACRCHVCNFTQEQLAHQSLLTHKLPLNVLLLDAANVKRLYYLLHHASKCITWF